MSGLLVLTAHPDDEVLIAGGTLAACAAAEIPTAVVCLTRGELGPIAHPALATRENLGAVRVSELRTACTELRVDWVKCYRRPDGSLRWSDQSGIARQLAGLIETRRPDAVITFGDDGLYYHPDHIATYDLARRALARLADPPALYRSVWPRPSMIELGDELRRRGLSADLWGMEPEDFGTDDLDGSFAIDVRRFTGPKLRALRAHRTQVSDDLALTALDDELVERFIGVEWFAPVDRPSDWLQRSLACV